MPLKGKVKVGIIGSGFEADIPPLPSKSCQAQQTSWAWPHPAMQKDSPNSTPSLDSLQITARCSGRQKATQPSET